MHEAFVEPSAAHADFRLDGTGDLTANLETVVAAVDRLRSDRPSRSRSEAVAPGP
jgi:hypothetical protein